MTYDYDPRSHSPFSPQAGPLGNRTEVRRGVSPAAIIHDCAKRSSGRRLAVRRVQQTPPGLTS